MNYPLNYYDPNKNEIEIMHNNVICRVEVLHSDYSSVLDTEYLMCELLDEWTYEPYNQTFKYAVFSVSHNNFKSINNAYFEEKKKDADNTYITMVKGSLKYD